MEKRVILIGHGQIPRAKILELLAKKSNEHNSVLLCKRCKTPHNLLNSGYCIDCEEELESQAK